MAVVFNKEMNILKAIAIIAVVCGHASINVLGNTFPDYSYHMALFFFIAGYFYKEDDEKSKIKYIAKKAKRLLIPLFLYNIFYALITIFIFKKLGILLSSLPSLATIFINPFLTGKLHVLNNPLWFIAQLFVTLITFIFIYAGIKKITKNKIAHFIFFLALTALGIFLAEYRHGNDLILITSKTLFTFFFVYLGIFYKSTLEKKNIFTLQNLLIITIAQIILTYGKNINYFLANGTFYASYLAIFTSVTGIWVATFVAKIISPLTKDGDFLNKVGKNTYHIMANHLLIFFILNYSLAQYKHFPIPLDVYWIGHHYQQLGVLYVIISITLCVYIGEFLKKIPIWTKKLKR